MLFIPFFAYTYLAIVSSLTTHSFSQSCNSNPEDVQQPFGQETTKHPSAARKLREYYANLTCFDSSDGSRGTIKEQCKNLCPSGEETGDEEAVLASQSCIFQWRALVFIEWTANTMWRR